LWLLLLVFRRDSRDEKGKSHYVSFTIFGAFYFFHCLLFLSLPISHRLTPITAGGRRITTADEGRRTDAVYANPATE